MSRIVVALLVTNIVVGLWWMGYLSPLLEPPGASEREPLRLSRQLQLESLTVLRAAGPPGSANPAGAPRSP